MKPSALVDQLVQCPSLANTTLVGLDLTAIKQLTPHSRPTACVVLIGDDAERNDLQNATRQSLLERFEVLLLLDASPGVAQALEQLDDLRAELWRALVGWKPQAANAPVEYAGGELLLCDPHRVLYRYRFIVPLQLGRNRADQPAETWHERQLDGLAGFERIRLDVDAIDPADPNLRRPGPDGRIEMTFTGELDP